MKAIALLLAFAITGCATIDRIESDPCYAESLYLPAKPVDPRWGVKPEINEDAYRACIEKRYLHNRR